MEEIVGQLSFLSFSLPPTPGFSQLGWSSAPCWMVVCAGTLIPDKQTSTCQEVGSKHSNLHVPQSPITRRNGLTQDNCKSKKITRTTSTDLLCFSWQVQTSFRKSRGSTRIRHASANRWLQVTVQWPHTGYINWSSRASTMSASIKLITSREKVTRPVTGVYK